MGMGLWPWSNGQLEMGVGQWVLGNLHETSSMGHEEHGPSLYAHADYPTPIP